MKILTNELKPTPTQIYLFARAIDEIIREYYKDPAHEALFQEWMAKKKEAERKQ